MVNNKGMKQILIILFSLLLTIHLQSQNNSDFFKTIPVVNEATPEWARLMYSENPNVPEVENLYRQYYKTNEFIKTIHTQNHKQWILLVEPFLDPNGYIKQPNKTDEDIRNELLKENYIKRNSSKIPGTELGWVPMGPFETFKNNTTLAISWHKNIYSIDQSLSNPDILVCGTEAGGVYKTTDKASNWSLISKGEVFSGGNSAVKIHPTNQDVFLISSNNRIYQTIDGGISWSERHYTDGTGNEFEYSPANNNIIFHTSSAGLFKSLDGGVSWNQVYSDNCWDIDFHPTDNNIVYLLKSNTSAKRSELFRSNDGGNTWILKDNGYYVPADLPNASDAGGKIAVTPAAPDLVYVCLIGASKADDSGWIGVYKSFNMGDSWINPTGQDGGPYGPINGTDDWNVAAYSGGYHQGFFNFDMEASATDPDKIWIATIRLTESNDGGNTYQSIGAANSNRLDNVHADVQDIEVVGNDIWVATDGGVDYSNDELISHVALNKGIQAAHFWGFNTGWNEDTYVGGKYHDGTSGWYENYGINNAYNIGGVEEASGYVHPIESRKLLFRTHYASSNTSVKTIPSIFGDPTINHTSLPVRPNESYNTAERSGVYYDPRYARHIYVGLDNNVYKSTDGGANFDIIFTFPDQSGVIYEMEISRSNPDVIYGVYNKQGGYWDACEIWKSIDGGESWNKTLVDPSGNNKRFRISIHPEDENKVWICTPRGDNGAKVHYTSDGGNTWVNKTTSVLDGESLTDIMYQGGTNDIVYVVSNNGVFYWDTNTSNWLDYSTDLPLIAKSLQLNPFYRDAELRLGTRGRGVWARKMQDTLFAPIAQPITYSDTVFCSRDTVQFDCYSMLKHNGATWDWSITPDPLYISSDSTRNPMVIFGSDGNYDVSLTVTDDQGNSNTKTIPNMITVLNSCDPDSIVGNALTTTNDGDYCYVPDLNLTDVTHFTTSAWIKPLGGQSGFAGIVSNGEWCAHCNTPMGLIFDYWGNKLYYRWPDGSGWGNNSGMTVPLNEWSYVAMVVTPDSVTLYMNEQQWVSHVTLSPVDFPELFIGKGHYSSFFKGKIDEVTIWNRALSQSEIRELRHLTKDDIINIEPNLVAYYQFNNSTGSSVFDNAKDKHGQLIGAAILETSTAPVGPGTSNRKSIDNSGIYTFENTGLEIGFGNSNPNGEIVVSRLNVYPNSLPNSNPSFENYWIINNYGTPNFGTLDSIKFESSYGITYGDPLGAMLHTRGENEYMNNWAEQCSAEDYDGGTYNYNNSCNITNTHQFCIQSDDSTAINKMYFVEYVDTSICSNQQIFLGGAWQNTAGVYYDTLAINPSIDSVFITTLSIIPISTSTDTIVACDSLTWIDGVTYTESNNIALYVLTNAAGCDSIIALDLTINYTSYSELEIITCDSSYTVPSGNHTYTESGIYMDTIPNTTGCDSIMTIYLEIVEVDTTVTVNSPTLTANEEGAIYQWIDCESMQVMPGDTNQSYTAVVNGIYAVIINEKGCIDTSSCHQITGVFELGNNFGSSLKVYPNPTTGNVIVYLGSKYELIRARILNANGITQSADEFYDSNKINLKIIGEPGFYFVEIITTGNKKAIVKIVKE